ncbi:hypothetical protein NDU88_005384 [Pleurodeles waltl]|uniref:Uncharacterized protein n=1 Tax=Pleurodeles waltl TaxID=8319 RepID=A0AAV7MXW0_PLEWA|nr:hypothetical protein NDU88_005384 [Pleurodeles waltl]
MGAWGSCSTAAKEKPEVKAAPKHRDHQKVAAQRLARLPDPDASRAEPGASLSRLCLCYPGSVVWPPPLYACGGSRQPKSSVGTAVDLPGRREPQCKECPSTVAPGWGCLRPSVVLPPVSLK